MKPIALLAFAAASATGLLAQSNVIPGLDGRLTVVDDLTYWGRRGAAFPNGEVGMSMLNTMCNPGSALIEWRAAMNADHPMFGFLIARVHNGKIEQINDWSHCKHAFTSTNFSGSCGTCISPPAGGAQMGLNCSDTYGAGNNGDRFWLGPAVEINPWLGTWNPVGSYFDRGDPPVSGAGLTDGVRSLTSGQTGAFDAVKNRVTVKEQDLVTSGAAYFYGIQLIHRGEAVANRGDNLASRGFNPVFSGGSWTFANNAVGQAYGSILNRWPGAEVNAGQNGNDDGRFFVASVVTPLGGGNYHYEYAVHNFDNHRGGATLRIPIEASATASNFTFGDIDTNALNDWTAARVGNEIVFTAPGSNPLNWNTIYNFGFDATFAPGNGVATIDQARVGPGNLTVSVTAKSPSGSTVASATPVGTGCGGTTCQSSFYEFFPAAAGFDLANSRWALTWNGSAYTLGAGSGTFAPAAGTTLTLADDQETQVTLPFALPYPGGTTNTLWVCSNGYVSAASNGTEYNPSAAGFLGGATCWAAMFHDLNPAAGGQVRFDASPTVARITFDAVRHFGAATTATFQYQFFPNGTVNVIYQAVAADGNAFLTGFTPGAGAADPGSWDISANLAGGLTLCSGPTPNLALASSARPVLGTTIQLNTSNIRAGSLLGLSILSTTQYTPGLDLTFLGMPLCTLYAGLDSVSSFPTPGSTASVPFTLPATPSLSGVSVVSQSATLTPGANAFGFVTSNGVVLLAGLL